MENSSESAGQAVPPATPVGDGAKPAPASRLPVAICDYDAAGNLIGCNPPAAELLGVAPGPGDPISGGYRLLTLDGEEIPPARSPVGEALAAETPQLNIQLVVERQDGSRRLVVASAVPQCDAHGTVTGAVQFLTDLSECSLAGQALRTTRNMFETLFESAPDAILVVAHGTGIIFRANRQVAAMFGYTAEELQGQQVEILIPERFRAHHMHHHTQYLDKPKVRPMGSDVELFGLRKDGREFPVDVMLGAIETEQGIFALTIIRDLSERRAAEAERQARRAAEAASKARSEFLANMSHELRSPLNTILGFTRLIAADPQVAALAAEDLERVIKSGKHLHGLINQVLDISKLDAGRTAINEADFDLFLLLDDVRAMFAPAAAAKGLALTFSRRPELPHYIRADAMKLHQILINLVDNAVKFTDHGHVRVSVECTAGPDPAVPRQLRFVVADSGPGIAADELATLFQPFAQGKAGRYAAQGTGLGLAISRGFAQLLGGDIHVESTPGRGAIVTCEIPCRVAATAGERPARFRLARGLAEGQPRYRMLVVDDQPEARELVARLLSPLGFLIKEAGNGLEAIDLWQQWRPHVIWMDLALPALDGLEATRRIRAARHGQAAVIIALTALSGDEDRARALEAGCNDVLYKPMRESDLFAALEKHLGVQFIYEESAAPAAPKLDPSALARLPAAQRTTLEAALLALDSDAVDHVIESLYAGDPQTATALAAHAREYQYETILAALRAEPPAAGGG